MENTLSQGYSFLAYLYAGIVLALAFDALHIVITLIDRRAVTHICDAVFTLLFLAVVYTVMGLADNGKIRLYGLCSIALGAALSHWAIGRPICKRIVKRHV